jgi:hypothetical protein
MICVSHISGGISIVQVDKTKRTSGVPSGNMGAFVVLEDEGQVKEEL